MIDLLDDESAIVRFWAAFGLGTLNTRTALPRLQALTSDDTPVPRWWTVGEEAADAIDWIEGRIPAERVAAPGATGNTADPQNPLAAEGNEAERAVHGERTHRFDAPPAVLFRALTVDLGKWLPLQPGEVLPTVLEALPPLRFVWSSLWPVSPDDTIEFELTSHTTLRYRWWSNTPPDARGIGITRQRINRKIGSDLRGWLAAHGPGWEHPSTHPRPPHR